MQKKLPEKTLHIFAVILIASSAVLALYGDFRAIIDVYLVFVSLMFSAYFMLVYAIFKLNVRFEKQWIALIAIAVLCRLVFFLSDPILSDDVYRYLWDGKVFASGHDPYAFPPADKILSRLQDDVIYPKINHPEIPTVYGPLAQTVFLINYITGNSLLGWRLILLLFETGLVLVLWRLLQHFRVPEERLVLWLFNPLVIIETYFSAHLEIIAVTFFLTGVLLFYKRNSALSAGLFAGSMLVKFTPLAFVWPFLRRNSRYGVLIIAGILAIGLLPFLAGDSIPMAGFISFANRWEFNGFFYKLTTTFIETFDFKHEALFSFYYNGHLEYFYLTGALFYKLIAFFVFVFIVIDQWKKLKFTVRFESIAYLQAAKIITAALMLMTPTLYPWYLLWIIPYLLFTPNVSWLLFTWLIQFSYIVQQRYALSGVWQEEWWVLVIEYVPFLFLLWWEFDDSSNITGWLGVKKTQSAGN